MRLTNSTNRWRRFNLRFLLLLVTFAACFFAWMGRRLDQAGQQRIAVAEIMKTGGVFEYDYAYHHIGQPRANAKPNGPQWLRSLPGAEFFDTPIVLYLYNSQQVGVQLSQLDALPHLTFRALGGSNVSDQQLRIVAELRQLRHLNLRATNISDAGVAHLRPLPLEGLDLMGCAITDNSVSVLANLKDLEHLNIWGTQISPEGITKLRRELPNCDIKTRGRVVQVRQRWTGPPYPATSPPQFRSVDGRQPLD